MGVFQHFKKMIKGEDELNVDEFMDAAKAEEDIDIVHPPKSKYVKPVAYQGDEDVSLIKEELTAGNFVLLNIALVSKNPNKLKNLITELKTFASGINGDIARIDEDKILIVPNDVGIIKRRKS